MFCPYLRGCASILAGPISFTNNQIGLKLAESTDRLSSGFAVGSGGNAEGDYGFLQTVSESVTSIAFEKSAFGISPLGVQAQPAPKSTFCPTEETWWPGLIIIIAVCCATLVFLFVVVIICYKAIKRSLANVENVGLAKYGGGKHCPVHFW
ncbi:hypothetical protein BTVI_93248 [Pitangus sulphuratus]|nr:hypothetical protein BTVI_93248 [Pitangus sulphuratus]